MKSIELPKISIITPSYNQGIFIEKTIKSVINQPYPNIEYIIIDGGSTDNTLEIIKKYEDKIYYWCSEKDRGQSHALNKGFEKATGEVIGWINSDDYYEDNIFPMVMSKFKNEKVDVINGDCTLHFSNGNPSVLLKGSIVTSQRLLYFWRENFCPPQPSIFFKKSILDQAGPINEQLNFGMDMDLWLRMSKISRFTYFEKNLSHYLIHTNSKSGSDYGFSKFENEWKNISLKHLKTEKTEIIISYWKNYFLEKKLNSIFYKVAFSKAVIEAILRKAFKKFI